MWFNNATKMWTTKKELAGAYPTSGPHPLIGKTFQIEDENPFEELYCIVRDVRKNKLGIEYVSYSYLHKDSTRPMVSTHSERLDTFNMAWEEVK